MLLRISANTRVFSTKYVSKGSTKYSSTINLPRTKFPNRLTTVKRQKVERELLDGKFLTAYKYQEKHNAEPTFVLHDGPPYANGNLHMGHAVNKVLKDITLRHRVVTGQKVHYILGWDCHGLPIELKALAATDSVERKQDALSVRMKSRQFALKTMEIQKQEFRSWGILSDWNSVDNMYLTCMPSFITNQLKLFLHLFKSGLIYRDLKPVYWSPSSRTALAEAELEYDQNFISPSVYIRFTLHDLPKNISDLNCKVYALVWTTTPWTLPSNQAICYNSSFDYSLVTLDNHEEIYLVATNAIKDFENNTKIRCNIIQTIKGTELFRFRYQHPISKDISLLPFFDADHVQDAKGTGLVHTAPAHGPEDFLVSLRHKLPLKSFVNEDGKYTDDAPEFLRGKTVLNDGNELVLAHLASDIVFAGKLTHAYPIDWRTKKPVIIRASEQWFINTEALKDCAVEEINKIDIYPRISGLASKNALTTQIRKRPYWCISRQRVWGVPIPAFYERKSGQLIINQKIIEHICNLVDKEGNIDFWWSKSINEILPIEVLTELNLNAEDVAKGDDIFDIWFDSGSSWSSVLRGEKIADVYIEGYDQFTGWFQSSLLTSVAARNCAPYKSLFVHGFTVDETGCKMSKSLGNIIEPKDITSKYGTDVLRWWVASHGTQHMSITVSDRLLQQSAETFSKIRNTIWYLLGVIGERSSTDINSDANIYLNRYLLSALVHFEDEIQKLYNAYEYNRVTKEILNFVTNQVSAVYLHLIKDRLYCGDNTDTVPVRFALTKCYELICKSLWPITPFIVEESWNYFDASSAFHEQNVKADLAWKSEEAENVVNNALYVKRLLNQQVGDINTWTLGIKIICKNAEELRLLQLLQPHLDTMMFSTELCEILQVNNITLTRAQPGSIDEDLSIEATPSSIQLCLRCRRFAVESSDSICVRCTEVLKNKFDEDKSHLYAKS